MINKRIIINLNSGDPLTAMDKIKYCLHVWVFNFSKFESSEKDYYMGITNKNPHGIKDFYWQKAYMFYTRGIYKMGNDLLTWLS